MTNSAWTDPGLSESPLGYSLVYVKTMGGSGSRVLQAQLTVVQDMRDEDLQEIVDALAGIPGTTRISIDEGVLIGRKRTPDRSYVPLPPPPPG